MKVENEVVATVVEMMGATNGATQTEAEERIEMKTAAILESSRW